MQSRTKVAICDIDNSFSSVLPFMLETHYRVVSVPHIQDIPKILRSEAPRVLLVGVSSQFDVLSVSSRVVAACGAQSDSAPHIIALTPPMLPETLLEMIRLGVNDVVLEPATPEQVVERVHAAFPTLVEQRIPSKAEPGPLGQIIGLSDAAEKLRYEVKQCARCDAPVLFLGESGTGKDLAARVLHELSDRSSRPFVQQNCAAIPDTLSDSELFGSERGAFTDARSRPGRFEEADQGTLFLDEIGEMSRYTQAKLLRVLEDGMVRRVGSNRVVPVNVRILSATNREPRCEIEQGRFRADLYHRLAVLIIRLPSLKERLEDIPLLAAHHLVRHHSARGLGASAGEPCIQMEPYRLSQCATERLMDCTWPGNVRELMNVLDRSVAYSDQRVLRAEHIRMEA